MEKLGTSDMWDFFKCKKRTEPQSFLMEMVFQKLSCSLCSQIDWGWVGLPRLDGLSGGNCLNCGLRSCEHDSDRINIFDILSPESN